MSGQKWDRKVPEGIRDPDEASAAGGSGKASWRKGQRAALGDFQHVARQARGEGGGRPEGP